VVATGLLRVYSRNVRDVSGNSHRDVFACRLRGGHPRALADPQLPQDLVPRSTLRARGLWVAAAVIEGSGYDVRYSVRVLDLRRARPRVAVDILSTSSSRTGAPVTDLELGGDGAVGWISLGNPAGVASPLEVWTVKPGVAPVLIGRSSAIRPRSLSLRARRLRWRDGGQARTAPLP
jgi:hypothetical protein